MQISRPALFISAPASGQGKTTVTAALARLYSLRGMRVRVFKTGPDFLDPKILEVASGFPVENLDLWMVGEEACRRLLAEAAQSADILLIEGVMGLFDGEPSSADLAQRFGIPILAVIDASAMAQTFAAISYGLVNYRPDLNFAGVLANRVGSERHAEILGDAMPHDIPWYGAIQRSEEVVLPSRHLGLLQSSEITDLDQRLNAAAAMIEQTAGSHLPATSLFSLTASQTNEEDQHVVAQQPLKGVRIGVARDEAFSFIYPANLRTLLVLGAQLTFFSPLCSASLEDVDALYLPGGYPELYLKTLSDNAVLLAAIRTHIAAHKPVVAECGGMLYLCRSLTDKNKQRYPLVGALAADAYMQARLSALAFQSVTLEEGTLRGHTFHHSVLEADENETVALRGVCPNGKQTAEAVYRKGRLYASYIHHYFPSSLAATAALFKP